VSPTVALPTCSIMKLSFAVVMAALAACGGAAQHPPVVNPPVVQTCVATPTPVAEEPPADATAPSAQRQRVAFSIGAAQLSTLKASAPAGLSDLTVTGCGRLADLVPLRAITTLTRVQLGTDDCLEVSRLEGLELVKELRAFAVVDDVGALTHAKHLDALALQNGVMPVAALAALPLRLDSLELNLQKNSPSDVALLMNGPLVHHVRSLSLDLAFVPTVAMLPELPELESLSVSMFPANTDRGDLAFVGKAPHVKHLVTGGVQHADLAPILALRELETLDIAGICHVDARALERLPNLTSVTVSIQVDATAWPVRAGLEVTTSNPYAICSGP
jgi:hypothetical protein